MKSTRVGCLILAIVVLICAGCGQKSDSGQQPIAQNQIQPGGQLVYGSLYEPNTLNPLMSDLLATSEVGSLIFSGLVVTNEKGEHMPDLAVEIPTLLNRGVSPDGLTVTYRLRQGVTWHDGVPFTADDVKFTWQTIMNPKVNVVSREGYNKIAAIDTPDQYTVVIRFKEYYASYLTLFTTILPKHLLETAGDINKAAFNRAPIGTGPFKFKEWRIAEAVILEKNPGYFRGKPNLDSIVYKIMPDINILLTQLKSGEVHVVSNINFNYLEQVKAIDGVRAYITPNMLWEHLDFNLDNNLFQDVRVRQAISLGIDRQGIVNTMLKNVAVPAAGDQSPTSWAYNPVMKASERNVNAAKELLVQAGWKQGTDGIFAKDGNKLAFSLAMSRGNKLREGVAQAIAQQLKEVGIVVEIRPLETSAFFNDILKNRRFETAMYAWTGGSDPDNINLWHSKRIPGRANGYEGQNYPGWKNPQVDSLTEQAVRTPDLESRKQLYFRIQEVIRDDVPVVPLYFHSSLDAVRKNVANYKPNPTSAGNLWNAWEWGFTK